MQHQAGSKTDLSRNSNDYESPTDAADFRHERSTKLHHLYREKEESQHLKR